MTIALPAKGGLTGRKVLLILMCFFGTVFAADTFLMMAAFRTWSGLDEASPYRAGQVYNRDLAQARAQEIKGWALALKAEREPDGAVRVSAEARDAGGRVLRDRTISAVLQRPTDKRQDRALELIENAPGSYSAIVDAVAPGQWELVVDVIEGRERAFRRQTRIILN